MSNVTGYPPPPYGYYPQPGGYPPPGYPPQPGMPPQGTDHYSQGYQRGAEAAAGTAGQITNVGNTLTNTSTAVYGTMSTVVGTTAGLLGTVSNTLTSLFGGMGSYGATNGGYYQQPGYGTAQPGQVYGPAWGPDMQQAHAEAQNMAYTATSTSRLKSAIDNYADAAADARKRMQETSDRAKTAIQNLQAAVTRLQQNGGPASPQGQALLAEIHTLRAQATAALGEVDQAARQVYINAYKAQVTFWVGVQRHPNLNSNGVNEDIGRAWASYNGAPTERLHWYSLSKSPVPNAVTLQRDSHQQVQQALTTLDNMLRQGYSQPAPTGTSASGGFLPR